VSRGIVQALPILAVIVLSACSSRGSSGSLIPQGSSLSSQGVGNGDVPFVSANPVRQLCPTLGTADRMQCFASVRTDVMPQIVFESQLESDVEKCPFSGQGYCPIDLQNAYNLPSLSAGKGKTVAIVDAYGYRHASGDLAIYRKTMGLKACTLASKCLRIVNQEGHSSPLPHEPPASDDWRGEQSLDLDMVSAICPNCKIILVQTNNNYTTNLYAGVKTAGTLGPKYIGVSWGGGPEGSDNPIFHQPGVVIAAAAGDNGGGGRYGGGPIQPCTYTYVVCVGGSHLVHDVHKKRGWNETVWNDWTLDSCGGPCGATGSACSQKIAKPSWQHDVGCRNRSAADTSATASLRAPVIVYNSEIGCNPPNCFWLFGGTSASTQIIAGVYALAGNAASQHGAQYLWQHHVGHVYDVTIGNNLDAQLGVTCASSVKYICTARVGFDGPTGWGTPNGIKAF
jgi:subtilase family serine protease